MFGNISACDLQLRLATKAMIVLSYKDTLIDTLDI